MFISNIENFAISSICVTYSVAAYEKRM